MTDQVKVWKFEGLVWSRKSQRYVTRTFWNCKVGGKVFEGFGTRKEAKEYAETALDCAE